MTSNIKGAVYALIGFALYSCHDVVVKFLGTSLHSVQILFFTVLFSFPLISFMLLGDPTAKNLRPIHTRWMLARTVALVIGSSCIFYAFSSIPLSQTYAILFATPLFVTLLAIPILGERVGVHRLSAVVLGMIGVLIVVRPGVTTLEWGHLAALTGAFAAAIGATIVRKIGRKERGVVMLLYPILGNFVAMGTILPTEYQPMSLDQLFATAMIAFLGFVAMNCMLVAYKSGEAAVVAPMQYSQILWAALFGAVFFDELPDRYTVVGASLIILSGLYILWREARPNTSQNQPVTRARTRLQVYTPVSVKQDSQRRATENKAEE
jgi:drug/metabolite transporter (DMT)-like permease